METIVKKLIFFIPIALIAVFGCTFFETIVGSGYLVERQLSYSGFDSLEINAPFEITLIQDDEHSVTLMADDNVIEHVVAGIEGTALFIDLEPYYGYVGVSLKAVVTMPEIREIHLSSASNLTVIGSTSFPSVAALDIAVSDASRLLLPSVVATTLSVEVSGASRATVGAFASNAIIAVDGASELQMDGSAYTLDISVRGASDGDLSAFNVDDVDATVSGASEAWIRLDGTLRIDISGASTLYYYGQATWIAPNIADASSVIYLQ